MAARERVEFDVIGRDLGGSKAFRDVGDAADKAGDKIKDSGEKAQDSGVQYRGLAHEIEQVEGNVRRLAAEIDKTGNKELFGDLRKQQSELRKLNRVKDLLPDMNKEGEDAASDFSAGFITKVGPLLAKAPVSGAGAIIGGVLAAALLPPLSAAVAGAVVGGAGVGGVVGGIRLAAQDARVQAAAKQLGETVMADLNESGARFVGPTLRGIGIIRSAWQDVSGDVDASLVAAARYLEPLARGVADAVREMMPGIRQAVEAAGPIVREISEGLPRLGDALGDVMSDFAEDADAGASAVRWLFGAVEGGIRTVGGLVHAFAQVYRVALDVADVVGTYQEMLFGWNPLFGPLIKANHDKVKELKGALEDSGQAGENAGMRIWGGLSKVNESASAAAAEVETLSAAIMRMAGENLSAEQANIRLEEAIDRATEAGKRNNDGIDVNTEKGRENRKLLVDVAGAANQSAEAILKQTGSQELAAQATERGRAQFLAAARAMGVEAGEAQRLADQLFGIPKQVNSEIDVSANTQPAIDSARNVVARINAMHARISVGARGTTSFGGSAHTGEGYSTGYSHGGRATGPGTDTSDSIVTRVSRDEYVIRAAAARAIGYDTLDQLNQADRRPVALRAAGAVQAAPASGSELLAELRGLRQDLARTPLVRLDPGRMANLLSR